MMKFSQLFLATVAISITYADFWMVYQHRYAQIGLTEDTSYGASFISDMSEWTCEADTFTHRIHPDRRNISGQNYGVQFEPWNPQPGPLWHDPLGSVNMNLDQSPIGGQTISIHNNYTMVDVNNDTSGQCYLNRSVIFDLDCWYQHADPSITQLHVNINGSSMFFYESDIEMSEEVYSWKDILRGRALLTPVPLTRPEGQ
ncbi:hypothetical protein EV127DRAFT_510231 [Xylaria flabelliformis]|nr:hypothetical protein EV127DRAFT_510231 [Xylaria flabelliformis]